MDRDRPAEIRDALWRAACKVAGATREPRKVGGYEAWAVCVICQRVHLLWKELAHRHRREVMTLAGVPPAEVDALSPGVT